MHKCNCVSFFLAACALVVFPAFAQPSDTLAKIRQTGVINLGGSDTRACSYNSM